MAKSKRSAREDKAEIVNTSSKMEDHWMVWVFSIFELVLMVIIFIILMSPVKLLISGNLTKGTVTALASIPSSKTNIEADPLHTPIVEFYTSSGEKISIEGSSSMPTSPFKVGDAVSLVYSPANPKRTQILSWTELPLIPAGFVLLFFIFALFIWISLILIKGDHSFDDPLGLLPWMISHFHLNPVRFPLIFILSLALPGSIIGTYVLTKEGLNLRAHGIRVIGHVQGRDDTFGALEYFNIKGGAVFVTFQDKDGETIDIKTSLRRQYTLLKPGEAVEIIYPVNKPHSAKLNTWSEIFLPPAIFGFFVVLFLIVVFALIKGTIQ